MSVNAGENVVGVYVGNELISGGTTSVKFINELHAEAGVTSKETYPISMITDKFAIQAVNDGISNFQNFEVLASNDVSFVESVKIAEGQFSTYGNNDEKHMVNTNGYKFFKVKVTPGSSQYTSQAIFYISSGEFL